MDLRYKFTKRQRNELFKIVDKYGIDHRRLLWTDTEEGPESSAGFVISAEADGQVYTFGGYPLYDCGLFHTDVVFQQHYQHPELPWEILLERFDNWMEDVAYELTEEDLWEKATKNPLLISNPESYSHDEKFTNAEAAFLRERLEKVEAFIVDRAADDPEIAIHIHQRITYLSEGLDKNSKVDWSNIFAAQMITIIADFASDHGPEILAFCAEQVVPFLHQMLHLAQ